MKGFHKLSRLVAAHRTSVRSVYAETLLENFFVSAVASVLAIRLYLHVSGYPSITVGGIHLAHVLLGGFLMVAALVISLGFLNRSAKDIAAVLGGIGFGAFIDELGKFITSDNDYFYEPAVALIYVAFVLLYFSIRFVVKREAFSGTECFANAFEVGKHASITGLATEERQLAFKLLDGCGRGASGLKAILLEMPLAGSRRPLLKRSKGAVDQFYEYVARKWWFTSAVVGFFAFASITPLSALVAVVGWTLALGLWVGGAVIILAALFWSRRVRVRYLNIMVSAAIVIASILITWAILGSLKQRPLLLVDWAQLVFPSISGVMVVMGLLLIPVSRLRAYRMFRRAVLISIFLTQVLAFYEYQFVALVGLLANIVILLALRYMISNEQVKVGSELK